MLYLNPLAISIDGHIPLGGIKGQLLLGYVGSLTEYGKQKIEEGKKK